MYYFAVFLSTTDSKKFVSSLETETKECSFQMGEMGISGKETRLQGPLRELSENEAIARVADYSLLRLTEDILLPSYIIQFIAAHGIFK